MALDPTWVWGILTASEALAGKQIVHSFRAPARFRENRQDVRQAKADGYSGQATTALSALTERVISFREPRHETEDGVVEAQPIADVLASTQLHKEVDIVTLAFEGAVEAKRCTRRCRHIHLGLGSCLVPVMVLVPIPLWPYLDKGPNDDLVTGVTLHVAITVLAIFVAASLILFLVSVWAENMLEKSLDAQKPDRARIGS